VHQPGSSHLLDLIVKFKVTQDLVFRLKAVLEGGSWRDTRLHEPRQQIQKAEALVHLILVDFVEGAIGLISDILDGAARRIVPLLEEDQLLKRILGESEHLLPALARRKQ